MKLGKRYFSKCGGYISVYIRKKKFEFHYDFKTWHLILSISIQSDLKFVFISILFIQIIFNYGKEKK